MNTFSNRVNIFTSAFWRLLPKGMRRRWWWFRLSDGLARRWPVFKSRSGLLAVRMDGIGDMVLFRQSLESYPAVFKIRPSQIVVLGCDSWREISKEVFGDIKVITINEHRYARHLLYRFIVNLQVRKLLPAVTVVDAYFRRALMSDSLAWVANAPRTIVAMPYMNEQTRAEYTWYMSQGWEIIDTGPYPIHETIRHAAFVTAIAGRQIKAEPPKITWYENRKKGELETKYAVLNPGSNEYGRRWPLANYVSLAAWLRRKGLRVVFIGKGNEFGSKEALRPFSEDKGIINMTGISTLPELLHILKGAVLVISNDTGPAHMSIALGTNTVVVVGGGHFGCFFPYPADVAPKNARFIYERMDCYHCFWRCHKRTDPKGAFPCIESVPVGRVEAACCDLLAPDDLS